MSFVINTNVSAMESLRHLNGCNLRYNRTIQQLASGRRIVTSADDPAGIAIAEKMKKDIKSTYQALGNTNIAISMLQVLDGAQNTLSEYLIRLKELSIQSATDTIHDRERGAIDVETQAILKDIDRLANGTEFNGTKLLNRLGGTMDIQIGINHDSMGRKTLNMRDFNTTVGAIGLSGMSNKTRDGAHLAINIVDDAIVKINSARAHVGGLMNALEMTKNKLTVTAENASDSKGRIQDADFARKTSNLARDGILKQTTISSLLNANTRSSLALKLID